MDTSKTALAARAVTALFLRQYFLKSILILVIMQFVAFTTSVYIGLHATTWWLLLSIFIALPLFISCLLFVATLVLIQRILPRKLSRADEKQVKKFVNDFTDALTVSKSARRSPFGLGSYILWSYLRNGNNRNIPHAITSSVQDLTDLKTKFQKIIELF